MRDIVSSYQRFAGSISDRSPGAVHESANSLSTKWSELELQALWYSGAFGNAFRALSGESIEIVQFGFWNKAAGPDFVHASIQVEGKQHLTGAIELHLQAVDWERHHHAMDPRYEEVILHVFLRRASGEFFARTNSNRNVLQIHLHDSLAREKMGLPPIAKPGACCAPLEKLSDAQIDEILETAARIRFERKAQWLQRSIKTHGIDEALFQAIAVALGYKSNKLPFLLISQRLTLEFLRREEKSAEAILLGVGGFLEKPAPAGSGASKEHWIRLWSLWWKFRGQLNPFLLRPEHWDFTGIRPHNHPQRRLAALSEIARRWGEFRVLPDDLKSVAAWFEGISHPFWNRHYTLASPETPSKQHLIGRSRIAEILANVIFPMFLISGRADWINFKRIRAQLGNRQLAIVCSRLFGSLDQRHCRYVYQQQGLLQVFEDFCLTDTTNCAQCRFPSLLQHLAHNFPG